MRKFGHYIVFYLFCYSALLSQNQVWEVSSPAEISNAYKKACSWFTSTSSYAFKLRYTSYSDAITTVKIESSEGYYRKAENNYITKVMGIKTIQNGKVKVVLDTVDKLVTIMDPGTLNPSIASSEQLETLLSNTKSQKKSRDGRGVRYRIEFKKNSQLDAYEFLINKSGVLESVVFFYAEQIEKIDSENKTEQLEKKIKPRLEINLFDFEVPLRYKDTDFSEKAILQKNQEKNFFLTEAYAGYRMLDYRTYSKK